MVMDDFDDMVKPWLDATEHLRSLILRVIKTVDGEVPDTHDAQDKRLIEIGEEYAKLKCTKRTKTKKTFPPKFNERKLLNPSGLKVCNHLEVVPGKRCDACARVLKGVFQNPIKLTQKGPWWGSKVTTDAEGNTILEHPSGARMKINKWFG